MVDRAIDSRQLVVVPSNVDAPQPRAAAPEEIAVSSVMAGRTALQLEGQRYSLLPAWMWSEFALRSSAHVVRIGQAQPILERLESDTKTTPNQKEAMASIRKLLVDRVAPVDPTGVILVRHETIRTLKREPDEPAITPSQMRIAPRPGEPLRTVTVHLERLYHDDEPLQGAAFELVTSDGSIVEGTLGRNGQATVYDLPEGPMQVRFGPDSRPYAVKDQTKNPEYVESATPQTIQALVSRYIK